MTDKEIDGLLLVICEEDRAAIRDEDVNPSEQAMKEAIWQLAGTALKSLVRIADALDSIAMNTAPR